MQASGVCRAGVFNCDYVSTVAGRFHVWVSIDSVQISGSPFAVRIHPSASNSTMSIVQNIPSLVPAGVRSDFVVLTVDRFGNRRSLGGENVQLQLHGPASISGATADLLDGSYNVSFTATVSGSYRAVISLEGELVSGKEYNVTVVPAVVHAATTSLSGSALSLATAGKPARFLVYPHDEFKNRILRPGEPISAVISSRSSEPSAHTIEARVGYDADDGVYTVDFFTTKAGLQSTYLIAVKLGEAEALGSPFSLHIQAAPANASMSVLSTTMSAITAGSQQQVLLHAADGFGNRREVGGDDIQSEMEGAFVTMAGEVLDHGNGSYSIKYQATMSGLYAVSVTLAGEHVGGSPFSVSVEPGSTSVRHSIAHGAGLQSAVAGATRTFLVTLCDEFGNRRQDSNGDAILVEITEEPTVDLSLASASPQLAPDALVTAHGLVEAAASGTHRVQYTLTKSARYSVHVRINDVSMDGSPFPLQVEPATPSEATSFARLQHDADVAAGSDIVVHLHVLDEFGNAAVASVEHVSQIALGNATLSSADFRMAAPGRFAITSVSRLTGLVRMQFSVYGRRLVRPPIEVNVSPGPLSAVHSTSSCRDPEVVSAGAKSEFQIEARDSYGNQITQGGADFQVLLSCEDPKYDVEGVVHDLHNGRYQVTYVLTLSTDYQVAILVKGELMGEHRRRVRALPGPVDPAKTRLLSIDLHTRVQTVAGVEKTLVLQTLDAFGNFRQIGGDQVTFQLIASGSQGSDLQGATDFGNGTYGMSFVATKSGAYALAVQVAEKSIFEGENSALTIDVQAAHPAPKMSRVVGAGVSVAVAGVMSTIAIHCRDAHDNPLELDLGPIDVSLEGNSTRLAGFSSVDKGAYSVQYLTTVAGIYRLEIKSAVGPVGDSPFMVDVQPAPTNATMSQLLGASVAKGVVGEFGSFYLQTFDTFGNKRVSGGDNVRFQLRNDDKNVLATGIVWDNFDGSYTLSYSATVSGPYSLEISIAGESVMACVTCTRPER
jgi:hypothetical protein